MANEMFQARLDEDFAEEVHAYRDEHHLSKSEAVREGLRKLVENEDTDEEAAQERKDRLQILARIGERVTAIGVLALLLGILIPTLSAIAISQFNLTIGTFGANLLIGTTLLAISIGTILVIAGGLLIAEVLIRHGIRTGYFGNLLETRLGLPNNTAS